LLPEDGGCGDYSRRLPARQEILSPPSRPLTLTRPACAFPRGREVCTSHPTSFLSARRPRALVSRQACRYRTQGRDGPFLTVLREWDNVDSSSRPPATMDFHPERTDVTR